MFLFCQICSIGPTVLKFVLHVCAALLCYDSKTNVFTPFSFPCFYVILFDLSTFLWAAYFATFFVCFEFKALGFWVHRIRTISKILVTIFTAPRAIVNVIWLRMCSSFSCREALHLWGTIINLIYMSYYLFALTIYVWIWEHQLRLCGLLGARKTFGILAIVSIVMRNTNVFFIPWKYEEENDFNSHGFKFHTTPFPQVEYSLSKTSPHGKSQAPLY